MDGGKGWHMVGTGGWDGAANDGYRQREGVVDAWDGRQGRAEGKGGGRLGTGGRRAVDGGDRWQGWAVGTGREESDG